MAIRVVRLGGPRAEGEGVRIGTVRRPPRGVPKDEFASRDYYDTWLPELSPSSDLVKQAQAATSDQDWAAFARAYTAQMKTPTAQHLLHLLATMSRHGDLAVGCYCEDENRCHRSVLRDLLIKAGAEVTS